MTAIDEQVTTDLQGRLGDGDCCQILDRWKGIDRPCDRRAAATILISCQVHGYTREGVCDVHIRLLKVFRKMTVAACRTCGRPVTWELL